MFRARTRLNLMTARIDIPLTPRADRTIDRIHAAFPRRMKYGFVLLSLNRTHALHSTHVMNAVHGLPPDGTDTLATPIIESRVTRAASSSSVSFCVSAGRSGSTRYRISAVLSHTRTS